MVSTRAPFFDRPSVRNSLWSWRRPPPVLGDLLGAALYLLAQLAGVRLGLGIEVGDAGHLDKLLLRLPEARDGIALPYFRLPLLALFLRLPLRTLRPLLPPRRLFLFRSLDACGLHLAPLRVIERSVLGPRTGAVPSTHRSP